MALTLGGNGQISSDNYTIDSDGDVTAVNAAVSGTLGVTGDATFDTSTLKVDATNNRVGIGTATPSKVLDITESASADTGQVKLTYAGGDGNRAGYILNNTHTGGREYGIYAGNNSTGGGLGNSLGISDNTAGTVYRLLINSDGHMTLPSQPYGEAEGTVGSTTTIATNNVISWFAANHLNGGVAFSNGGRFTVPTTGRYLVHYRLYFYPNSPISQFYQISLQKNGTEAEFMIDEEVMSTYSGSGRLDRGLSLTTSIRLSANDYIDLKYHGSATGAFYRGVTHNKFSVLLLG